MAMNRSRPLRFLRSRRLVVALFLVIGAYSVAATFLPDVLTFTDPFFLAAATIFTASTAICAQERARGAVALLRGWRDPSSAAVDHLAVASGRHIEVPEGAEEALTLGESALVRLGMRCVPRDDGVFAHRNAWAALGSPVFHYALAGLFLFAGLGQLTRWEGIVGVMEGGSIEDSPANYHTYTPGPLATHLDARSFAVDDFDTNYVHRDVERGPAPLATLLVDGAEVRSQRVYPNNPLRYGSLYVHQLEYGIGIVLSVLGPDGELRGSAPAAFDFDELSPDGTLSIEAFAEGRPAEEYAVSISVPLDEEGGRYFRRVPEQPGFLVSFPDSGDSAAAFPLEVAVGERVALPNGSGWLVVDEVAHQVWLFVVDDWTIPFIYLFLVVSCVGATVALLVPPRAAFLRYEMAPSARLVLVTRSRRIDPGFGRAARNAIETALAEERRGT